MIAFTHLTSQYIPPVGSAPYQLLTILSDGKPHTKQELLYALGDDPRSPLQWLGKEGGGFWKIDNLSVLGQKGVYQLDERHLLGNRDQDEAARKERRVILLKRSLKQAKRESNRLSKALEAMRNAQPEEQQRFIFDEKEAPTATNDQGHHLIHKSSNQAQGITIRPVSDEKSQRGTHP